MKKIALMILLLTCSIFAQTYYINIWSKGKVTSVPVSGIKKITFGGITGVGEASKAQAIINSFELFQNYPNPFNPSTRIEYQIPSEGHVTVHIYNVMGELVNTLINSDQAAGKYTVTWNGKNNQNSPVSSGIYIYKVVFGNSVLSRKMLLLK